MYPVVSENIHYNITRVNKNKVAIFSNFQPLEVVSRYRDPQTQVVEN